MATRSPQAQPNGSSSDVSDGASPRPSVAAPLDLSSHSAPSLISRLWQFPLLLVSLCLFGYAGYRLIDPQPGPTIEQRIEGVASLLQSERGEAATEVLRELLVQDEKKKLTDDQRGRVNLYLAQAVEQVQRARKLDLPANHQRILQYTQIAEKNGIKLDGVAHRRMADSYQALLKTAEALASFRHAIHANPDAAPALRRKIIEILVSQDERTEAEAQIKEYLTDTRLTQTERSWAIGEQSRLLTDRMMFAQARDLLTEAIKKEQDPLQLGQFHYRLGYCDWKLGDDKAAERYLRLARDQLQVARPEDAEAALLLGKILHKRKEYLEAISFFQAVVVSHPESEAAVAAKVGRGLSRIESGPENTEAGMQDLTSVVADINAKASRSKHKPAALEAIKRATQVMIERENFSPAVELLALEQSLEPTPSAEFFARMSNVYERRAAQLEKAINSETQGPQRVKKWQQWRDTLVRAADAAIAHSRGLTLTDDRGYGEALWRGIELYDRAGSLAQAIGALELFIAERPDDPLAPDALLRLGKAYHAGGQFDRAIGAFKRNQFRYERTLAAQKSGVPLAKSYIAKGPASYAKAEQALEATLQSPLLTPDADEFREALRELADLYYRTDRFEEAVQKLEEITTRYPNDDRLGQLLFQKAESYRKSALLLAAETKPPATNPAVTSQATPGQITAERAEREAARVDRLAKAKKLYDAVIEQYRVAAPKSDLDQLYLKLSHFYRADCLYDVGQYEEAIRLYDAAALRYQDDPSALTAYVQIVNAYAALGQPNDARTATERAKWLLQRMPAAAFKEAQLTMPQSAWENWVKWTKAVEATAGTQQQ